MTKQEYIEKIKQSSLSDGRKQQILTLLDQDGFSFEIREQIKDIIQADIDTDTEGVLEGEDDSEVKEAAVQLEKDLSDVENTLNDDMTFVESEMGKIETMTHDLDKAMDEKDIQDIKTDIANS